MSIDTLPKETHETEAIKPFHTIEGAVAWIENTARLLGESTTQVERKEDRGAGWLGTRVSEPENTELAQRFSQSGVDILFQQDQVEDIPPGLSIRIAPIGGWKLKDGGSHVLMRVEDGVGGVYNVTLDRKEGGYTGYKQEKLPASVSSLITYTTQEGTDLEHTTSAEIDVDHRNGKKLNTKVENEYLSLAASLRNSILWTVESISPEMKDALEVDDIPKSRVKKVFGRIAGGSTVKVQSK